MRAALTWTRHWSPTSSRCSSWNRLLTRPLHIMTHRLQLSHRRNVRCRHAACRRHLRPHQISSHGSPSPPNDLSRRHSAALAVTWALPCSNRRHQVYTMTTRTPTFTLIMKTTIMMLPTRQSATSLTPSNVTLVVVRPQCRPRHRRHVLNAVSPPPVVVSSPLKAATLNMRSTGTPTTVSSPPMISCLATTSNCTASATSPPPLSDNHSTSRYTLSSSRSSLLPLSYSRSRLVQLLESPCLLCFVYTHQGSTTPFINNRYSQRALDHDDFKRICSKSDWLFDGRWGRATLSRAANQPISRLVDRSAGRLVGRGVDVIASGGQRTSGRVVKRRRWPTRDRRRRRRASRWRPGDKRAAISEALGHSLTRHLIACSSLVSYRLAHSTDGCRSPSRLVVDVRARRLHVLRTCARARVNFALRCHDR